MPNENQVDLEQPSVFFPEESSENTETVTAQPSQSQSEEQVTTPSSGGEQNPVVEEQRVPYSRFETVRKARHEAEARASEAEQRLQAVLSRREEYQRENAPSVNNDSSEYKGKDWERWTRLYGDTPQTREAFQIEKERVQEFYEKAEKRALDAVRSERESESRALSQNENLIDLRLDELSEFVGRPMNPQEEDAVLQLVDEFTPKDQYGNYIKGALFPFEKAWRIYEMQREQASYKTREKRRVPTALSSTRTDSESVQSLKDKEDKDFDPRDWGAWKKKIPD